MAASETRKISLGLQGGGAHGAYTWGVLDRLLDERSLEIAAITATSAGAMNAVALAAGLEHGGRAGAQTQLENFWKAVSRKSAALAPFHLTAAGPFAAAMAWTSVASPYDINPFDFNPLRRAIESEIDFEAVRSSDVELFVSATDVESGRVKVFTDDGITADSVLASASLPQTFQAVRIDGRHYWDGGYVGNPSLFPLIYSGAPRDVLLVLLNPISRKGVPRSAGEIQDRINEISFNEALIGELRAIAFVQKLIDDKMLTAGAKDEYRRLNIHAIRGGQDLLDMTLRTKYDTRWRYLKRLRDMGAKAADNWIESCARHVGTDTSSVNLKAEFLGL